MSNWHFAGYTRRGRIGTASGSVLDDTSGLTAGWSMSRKLVTSYSGPFYTDVSGFTSVLFDQSGNVQNLYQAVDARPAVSTAGPNNIVCADFDGFNDWLSTASSLQPLSNFIGNAAGWMIISFIIDTITLNSGNPYANHPIIGDAGGFQGIYIRNTAGAPETAQAYNFDGTEDAAVSAVISAGTAYVVEWWHDSGNLFVCVNNGTPVSVASGNTTDLTNTIGIGHGWTGSSAFLDGKIFEAATASAVPATRSAIAANFMAQCGAV